jgi:hypothetical protein
VILLISTAQVARITDVSHWCLAIKRFLDEDGAMGQQSNSYASFWGFLKQLGRLLV